MAKPSIGRVVRYVLTVQDVVEMNEWCGAYLNNYSEGDEVTAVVVRVFDQTAPVLCNIKCHLDGSVPDFWRTSRQEGTVPGTWKWPQRD